MHLSTINAFLTRWTFRFVLLKRAYTRPALEKMVAESSFGTCEVAADGVGFELRLTKQGQRELANLVSSSKEEKAGCQPLGA
jgi:hypothetical protein